MVAISFKKQFEDVVTFGDKRQTIRPIRKYPIKAGDTLQLYVGMRTSNCRKLKEVTCRSVCDIKVTRHHTYNHAEIWLSGRLLAEKERQELALTDGFDSVEELLKFFEEVYGLPFNGVLIKW